MGDKEAVLLTLCSRSFKGGKTIVFFRTKQRAHRAKILFGLAGLPPAAELHGNMSQSARLDSLDKFRKVSLLLSVTSSHAFFPFFSGFVNYWRHMQSPCSHWAPPDIPGPRSSFNPQATCQAFWSMTCSSHLGRQKRPFRVSWN